MSLNVLLYHLFHENRYFGDSTNFIYFSFNFLCEFDVPDLYILLSPQDEEVQSSFWGDMLQNIHQKNLTICLPLYHHVYR